MQSIYYTTLRHINKNSRSIFVYNLHYLKYMVWYSYIYVLINNLDHKGIVKFVHLQEDQIWAWLYQLFLIY